MSPAVDLLNMMTVVVGNQEVCFDGSKLKTNLYMSGFGPDAVSAVRPARVCLISFATVFSCMFC